MCGRFTITVPAAEIAELLGLPELPPFTARFNIKPSQPILAVREACGKRNANVESIKEGSGLWRNAAKKGRCLVPVSAGYEWKFAGTKRSIAHAFGPTPRHSLFAVAGLIDNGTVALITCPPNPFMAALHHRMPAIMAPAEYDAWLRDGDLDLMRPFDGEMYAYRGQGAAEGPRRAGVPCRVHRCWDGVKPITPI